MARQRERLIEDLQGEFDGCTRAPLTTPVLRRREADERRPEVVYRPSGEDYLLVEFGPPVLDIVSGRRPSGSPVTGPRKVRTFQRGTTRSHRSVFGEGVSQ